MSWSADNETSFGARILSKALSDLLLSSQGSPPVADLDRRAVVAGVEQLLVAAGSSVLLQHPCLRCLVATSDLVDRSSLYAFTGQYKSLTRYVGSAALYRLAGRNGLLVLFLAGFGVMLRLPMPPRSSWFLLWLLLTGFTGSVRFALQDVLLSLRTTQHKQMVRVAIYGAGEAGAQLATALRLTEPQDCFFLDDNPAYWNRSINGVAIQPPQKLIEMEDSIDQVLLAIPSLLRSERRRIVDQLQVVEFLFCSAVGG